MNFNFSKSVLISRMSLKRVNFGCGNEGRPRK